MIYYYFKVCRLRFFLFVQNNIKAPLEVSHELMLVGRPINPFPPPIHLNEFLLCCVAKRFSLPKQEKGKQRNIYWIAASKRAGAGWKRNDFHVHSKTDVNFASESIRNAAAAQLGRTTLHLRRIGIDIMIITNLSLHPCDSGTMSNRVRALIAACRPWRYPPQTPAIRCRWTPRISASSRRL